MSNTSYKLHWLTQHDMVDLSDVWCRANTTSHTARTIAAHLTSEHAYLSINGQAVIYGCLHVLNRSSIGEETWGSLTTATIS